jgi:hypothetical protein
LEFLAVVIIRRRALSLELNVDCRDCDDDLSLCNGRQR